MLVGTGLALVAGYIIFRIWRHIALTTDRLTSGCVLVTGADYGFGKRIALRFHALGATVYAGCLSDEVAAKIQKEAGSKRMKGIRLDVRKDEDVDAARKMVESSGLPLLAVVNNAAVSAYGFAEELPLARYEANISVNYLGLIRVTKAFMPLLRSSRGRLINMSSVGARCPSAFGSAYLSTKAAMCSFTECVRQEVFRFGVRVCLVEPGFFATSLLENASGNGEAESKTGSTYPSFKTKMAATAELVKGCEALNGGPAGLEKVVDCVIDATCSRFPLQVYTVGYDAWLISCVAKYLPGWLFDCIQTSQDVGIGGLMRVLTRGSI